MAFVLVNLYPILQTFTGIEACDQSKRGLARSGNSPSSTRDESFKKKGLVPASDTLLQANSDASLSLARVRSRSRHILFPSHIKLPKTFAPKLLYLLLDAK
ncbi:hypothetical protein M9H77_07115 [Catharanthus roseus]|uniref:Uncharacterized protein n=1 Tax=Catharanthus roseus TaxID=4058 RepID=A0ACC0BU13_CATRO|nr:hypothetical protein M9H77_07115 [Catharanthus roseus]